MLGGDNMDNALGRHLELKLAGGTGKLDVQRWHQLVYQCRRAKETLLGETELDAVDVAVAGTGGRLIAGTLRGTLERDEVRRLGPFVAKSSAPWRASTACSPERFCLIQPASALSASSRISAASSEKIAAISAS